MNRSVDPEQQIDLIQKTLSDDKRPLGVFIGAGCPASVKNGTEPLIPDIEGITRVVCQRLQACTTCGPIYETLCTHFMEDGRTTFNVEDILSHVRALKSVAGNSRVRNLCSAELDQLDSTICNIVNELTDKRLPSSDTAYHKVALWAGAANRDFPVQFFTTNYDLLMEQALEDCEVPYFDGFVGSRRAYFDVHAMEEDKITPRWARLWKLHGSINWYQEDSARVHRTMAQENGARRVIHPSYLKYEESRRMPYYAMFDRLRSFLRQPSATLVIVGFSFRDEHLNREIIQGLKSNPTAAAFALMFGDLSRYELVSKAASLRPNLTVLADDAAVVGGLQGQWHEKEDDPSSAVFGDWVQWSRVNQSAGSGPFRAKVGLGDFASLGCFLMELAGRELHVTEAFHG